MINWIKDRNNSRKIYGFIGEIKVFVIHSSAGCYDVISTLPMLNLHIINGLIKFQSMDLEKVKNEVLKAYLIWLKKAGLVAHSDK